MLPWVKKLTKNKTTRIVFGLLVVFFCIFFFKNVVNAQVQVNNDNQDTLGVQAIDESNLALSGQDIRIVIAKIIRAVLGLLGIVVVVIIIYAGYEIMLSGGDEEKINRGKKILMNAVIGLAIILSSFIIVQFLLNALSKATGMGGGAGGSGRIEIDSFAGSGALGRVIKDHYPERDQVDVYRNASIIVTFADSVPVDPASIINNDNETCWDLNTKTATTTCSNDSISYYGDCVDLNNDGVISRKEQVEVVKPNGDTELKYECDTLNLESVIISNVDSESNEEKIFSAIALTSYENIKVENGILDANNYSFVFSPIELLGSPTKNVYHTVRLTNNILNKQLGDEDQEGIFSNQFSNYYEWKFETNTSIDIDPPFVKSVFPSVGKEITKNTIVSIQFSEAMNPLMVSGHTNGQEATSFTNLLLNTYFGEVTTTPSGTWKISNGYKTAEFIPDEPCGLNSCGDIMYCLPLDCPENDTNCFKNYEALVKTADLTGNDEIPFEAEPFTGVMDTAFNALDGGVDFGRDNVPQGKPSPGNYLIIDENEKAPDNFWWNFNVYNEIDREAPYIVKLIPDIDKNSVAENDVLQFFYSKPMLYSSLSNFSLEEFPLPGEVTRYNPETKNDDILVDAPIYFYSRMEDTYYNQAATTVQTVRHREFGPNDADLYYFPVLPSTIMSNTQNCLYPGRGPIPNDMPSSAYSLNCQVEYDDSGNFVSSNNCVNVNLDSNSDTGCMYMVNRNSEANNIVSSTVECLNLLEDEDISPYETKQ